MIACQGICKKSLPLREGWGVGKGWATKKTDYFFCSQYKIKHILLKPYYNHVRLCNQVEKQYFFDRFVAIFGQKYGSFSPKMFQGNFSLSKSVFSYFKTEKKRKTRKKFQWPLSSRGGGTKKTFLLHLLFGSLKNFL